MTHQERDPGPEAALETNVAELLKSASPTPVMRAEAKQRVLAALLAKQAATAPRPAAPAAVTRLAGRRPARREAFSLGAVALAAATLGFLMGGDAFSPVIVHENAGRGPKEARLIDGTRVVLDEGARVEERARGSVRLARGGAIFDVVGSETLRVDAAAARVKTRASELVVRAGDGGTRVAVARGRAEVSGAGGETILAAGQQVIVRGDEELAAEAAPRMSHLFGFARKGEGDVFEPQGGPPRRHGTLVARDPRWGAERALDVRDFTLDVHVEDGIARTTIDQTYFNADVRQLEGVYQFPLPHGAAISRLGMYVEGELMEAAVVDRDRGRDIYEGIVYQRRDPALLEWMTGNTFKMRIFPIAGRSEKRIFLSYTQPLERLYDTERLTVPIPRVDVPAAKVRFRVSLANIGDREIHSPSHEISIKTEGQDKVATFEASSHTLGDDFVLSLRSPGEATADVVRSFKAPDGERFVSVRTAAPRAEGPLEVRGPASTEPYVILFDTSASRNEEALWAQRKFVRELVGDLDRETAVTVIAVDHTARVVPGKLTPVGAVDLDDLDRRLIAEGEGAGDSRLDAGLRAAAELLRATGARDGSGTVVYVGDGVVTGGVDEPAKLAALLPETARFAAAAIGDTSDLRLLDAIADARFGVVKQVGFGEDLSHRAFDLVSTLRTPCARDLAAEVVDGDGRPIGGAKAHLRGRRACEGEQIDVIAKLPSDAPAGLGIRVTGRSIGGAFSRTVRVDGAAGSAGYLPRLWAQREIDWLLAQPAREQQKPRVVELALKNVLVTPYTSLLVLENDAMYREFGVEKRSPTGWAVYQAPAKIPVKFEPLGSSAEILDPSWELLHRLPTRVLQEGSLGLSGIGAGGGGRGQGFGSGSGRLGGMHRERPRGDDSRVMKSVAKERGPARRPPPAPPSMLKRRVPVMGPVASASPVAAADMPFQSILTESVALSFGEDGGATGWAGGTGEIDGEFGSKALAGAYPRAFASSYDARFDDLTEIVPALVASPVDHQQEFLAASREVSPGAAEDGALELLRRAARARKPAAYRAWDPAETVSVDGEGRVTWARYESTERVRFDGEHLEATYPELDLRVRRRVGEAAPWLLAASAPFVAPSAEAVAGLRVEVIDLGRGVRISAPVSPPADGEVDLPAIELTFDDQDRVSRVRLVAPGGGARDLFVRYVGDDVVVRTGGGAERTYTRDLANDPRPGVAPASLAPSAVLVEVPVSSPARIDERLKAARAGSDQWRALHHERLAAHAALGDSGGSLEGLRALLAQTGKVTRGELVLGSRGAPRLSDDEAKALFDSLPAGDPVRAAVEAARLTDSTKRRDAYAKLDLPPGALKTFTTARSLFLDLEEGGTVGAKLAARIGAFAEDRRTSPELRYAVVRVASDRARYPDVAVAKGLWAALGRDPALTMVAKRQGALLDPWTKPAESSAMIVSSFDEALDRGMAATVDYQTREIIRRGRGEVGYRFFWSRWQKHLREKGTAEQIIAFVDATAQNLAAPDNTSATLFDGLEPILQRFDEADGVTPAARATLARRLLSMKRTVEAQRILAPLSNRDDAPPEVLDLASSVAEDLGRLEEARHLVQRAIDLSADVEVPMDVVRARYGRLIALSVRRSMLEPQKTGEAITAALDAARRWRREDPDNADVDLTIAAALDRLGRRGEADRQLYSIVDRHPGDGDAWSRVAGSFEARGDLDAALSLWERATSVEATNPTWPLRKAQLLKARGQGGDEAAAKVLLERIVDGKWQDRFNGQVFEARSLLGRDRE